MGYEIQMFFSSILAWRFSFDILHPWLGQYFENARLETTLVHARILLDFFEHPANQRTKDDILAEDLDFPAKPVDGSGELRKKINKRLAHLTYARAKFLDHPLEKEWSSDVFDPLLERCKEFLAAPGPKAFIEHNADDIARTLWDDLTTHFVAE